MTLRQVDPDLLKPARLMRAFLFRRLDAKPVTSFDAAKRLHVARG